jgi:predicted MFS family arabinose efflux permease
LPGLFRRPRGALGAPQTVRPSFRDVRFGLLAAGETVNSTGSWASAIVLWGFAAYRFNASPYAVSLTILCWAVPSAVLSPLLGVWVDRIGPQKALVAGYLAAGAAALGMAAAGSLAVLDVAAVGYGIAHSPAGVAANVLTPRIVADDDLLAANALLGGASSAGAVAGPLAASVALALSGFPAAFILDAATYLVGAAVVLPLPLRPAPPAQPTGWRRELRDGIVLVARHRRVQLIMVLSAAVTFTSVAFLVVEPLYSRHVLHRPPSQFALFEAASSIGATLASLVIPRFKAHLTGRRVLGASGACYGLAACLFTGTTFVPAAYTGAFLWGISAAVFSTVTITTLQRAVPAAVHSRVMGVTAAVDSWFETIGLPLGGVTLAGLGIRAGALALAGVATLAGLAVALTSLDPSSDPVPDREGASH